MQEEAYAVRLGLKDSSSNFPMKPVGQPRVSSYVLPNSHKGHCEELVFLRATHLSREKYRRFDLIAVSLTLRVIKQWSLNQDRLTNKDIKRTNKIHHEL